MRIADVALWRYALPLARSLAAREAPGGRRQGFVVRLRDAAGHAAWGEAAPLPGHGSETAEAAEAALRRAAGLAGQEVPDGLETCEGALARWLEPLGAGPAARCALEAAILGLLAASRGRALRHLLAGDAADAVPLAGLIASDADAGAEASRLAALGHRVLKLKLTGRLDADLARIAAAGTAGLPLRLDANRAFAPDEAAAALVAMAALGVPLDFAEEPSRPLPPEPAVPLALDETLVGLPLAAALARLDAAPRPAAVVLKPGLLGLEATVRLARAARARGMTVVISSVFESGLGLTLCAEIAAACAAPGTAAGLGTACWFAADLVAPQPDPSILDLRCAAVPALSRLESLDA